MIDYMNLTKQYKSLPDGTKRMMNLGLILALVVALPLFVWALVNLNFNQKERAASGEPVDITAGEPIIGLPSASVTIVSYSDFSCPFCKSFVDNTMSTILANYPNDVKFVFKDFPLITVHPLAENAAIAGQCAFNQGKFWEMHDLIFAKQLTLTESDFSDFATQLSLDTTLFNICYTNKSTLPEVQDDMTEGVFKGVTGTPTFFINGTKLEGALPYSAFKTVIDAELGNGSTATATATATSTGTATTMPTATATATATPVEGEPNSCGGTCGSNYNCKSNLYCYQGFCRNPICSTETDCDCSAVSATATATAKSGSGSSVSLATKVASPKSSLKGSPKPTPTYASGITRIEDPTDLLREDEVVETAPENMFLTRYAMFIVIGFIIIAASLIIYAIKSRGNANSQHIMPPTNI